ncbi:hypothetical protein, partial [Deinococcus wulumuqiensis]|uniref:hypothetical protein n=1 Tax=Deinococcus wulumuqiensis TaxID=980427 RepID=UPI00242BCC66
MKPADIQIRRTWLLAHALGHPWATQVSQDEAAMLTLAGLQHLRSEDSTANPGYWRPQLDPDGQFVYENRHLRYAVHPNGDVGLSIRQSGSHGESRTMAWALISPDDDARLYLSHDPEMREALRPEHARLMDKLLNALGLPDVQALTGLPGLQSASARFYGDQSG